MLLAARDGEQKTQHLQAIGPQVWRKAWVVDVQAVGRGKTAVRYVARYVNKTALSEQRLLGFDGEGRIRLNCQDSGTGRWHVVTLSVEEFLRRCPANFKAARLMVSSRNWCDLNDAPSSSQPQRRDESQRRSMLDLCIPLRPSRLCGHPPHSMNPLSLLLVSAILSFKTFAAEESPADAKIRADIPLGGGLKPNPKVAAFVVVGHGARIITSKDDGKTWQQTLFATAGAVHGPWATKSVTYTNGVFAVPVGWGGQPFCDSQARTQNEGEKHHTQINAHGGQSGSRLAPHPLHGRPRVVTPWLARPDHGISCQTPMQLRTAL